MIKVENLSKSFGSVKAVDDTSFEIKKGEVVGFLGPNGAGKTTTMRMLTGFLSPDKGQIYIDQEQIVDSDTDFQKKIGYLPENNPLYQEMLVSEILNLSADLKDIPKEKRKESFDFVVSAVGIGDVYYRPVNELSKGYKQRVGMAMALLHRPKILIMDEPTEGLDPNQRTEIRKLIKELAKERTIILSTHVMQEASAVCSRLLIISKGKIVADGTTKELSKLSKSEKVIELEIEGNDVESSLRKLPGIEHFDIDKKDEKKIWAKIMTNQSIELQPEIAKLSHKNKWIIWKLLEQEHKLEDIFHKLTQ